MDNEFLKYLEETAGHENAAVFLYAMERPASVSVRFNSAKCGNGSFDCGSADSVGNLFGCEAEPVPWSRYGYLLDRRPDFTLDPLLHCGAYYVQDSSAMFVGEVFRKAVHCLVDRLSGRCVRVLDLCAAPGGKTTDLAASLREAFGDSFLLVANEVMNDRAGALSENVAKWGDPCVMVTGADPSAFAALPEFFDIVLADVPCSGEGMFRKDAGAREQWSAENVALCAARQRRIVSDVWPALRDGGIFIYSTCTFNKYENDGNVAWMLENLGCEPRNIEFEDIDGWRPLRTKYGISLLPGLVPGEGQFCAAVVKSGKALRNFRADGNEVGNRKIAGAKSGANAVHAEAVRKSAHNHELEQCKEWFGIPVDMDFNDRSGTAVAVPQSIAADVRTVRGAVRTLRAGCAAGTLKGRNIVPSADLALCTRARPGAFPHVEADLKTALSFLHRDGLSLPGAPMGYLTLLYKGMPLGFVKNLGTRCNNLLPQSRRIRMDIDF
ncbi:MAG: rRNA cytosine-C5-methyltransferase [Bacteroidales bacterium]|nr:rRNA cytosine-C5-methyltransferase [Bacteroidales bacterium]